MKYNSSKIYTAVSGSKPKLSIKLNNKQLFSNNNYGSTKPSFLKSKGVYKSANNYKGLSHKYSTALPKSQRTMQLLSSAFIGFINGFWGGGGGMVCVPALTNVLKLEEKKAHATTILIIFPLSVVSAIIYYYNGNIEFKGYSWVLGAFVVGGVLGAFLLQKFKNMVLKIVFGFIIIVSAIRLLV